MEMSFERDGKVAYAVVSGRVDGDTADGLRAAVLGGVEDRDYVVVMDMGLVSYVSSAGLQAFLVLAKQLRQVNVNFGLCNLRPEVDEVFRIVGFRRAMAVYGDRETAARSLTL